MFVSLSLAVGAGIAAWGPIFWGLGLILFGRSRIPSDFLLTPRFLIDWRYPRLIGLVSFSGGMLIVACSAWLAWFLA